MLTLLNSLDEFIPVLKVLFLFLFFILFLALLVFGIVFYYFVKDTIIEGNSRCSVTQETKQMAVEKIDVDVGYEA